MSENRLFWKQENISLNWENGIDLSYNLSHFHKKRKTCNIICQRLRVYYIIPMIIQREAEKMAYHTLYIPCYRKHK